MAFEFKQVKTNKTASNYWQKKIEYIRQLRKEIADLHLTTKDCYYWLGKMPKNIEMGYIYLLILNANNEKRFNVLGQIMVDFIDELRINADTDMISCSFVIENALFYVKFCDGFNATRTKKRLKQIIYETYKKGYKYYIQEQKQKQKQEKEKHRKMLKKKDQKMLEDIDELQKY